MKRWTWWWVTVGLLSGVFHGGSKLTVSATAKDRTSAGRHGHSRSPKHNSIANYYRDLHRPAKQTCVDEELPQRVRDATVIFTGTVRDMVNQKGRHTDRSTITDSAVHGTVEYVFTSLI